LEKDVIDNLKKDIIKQLGVIRGLFNNDEDINSELSLYYTECHQYGFLQLLKSIENEVVAYESELIDLTNNLSKSRVDAIKYVRLAIKINIMIFKYLELENINNDFLVNELMARHYNLAKNIIYQIQAVSIILEVQSKQNSKAGKGNSKNHLKIEKHYDAIKEFRLENKFFNKSKCVEYVQDILQIQIGEKLIGEIIDMIDKEIRK
jgi:hypothetical protein